MPDQPGGDIFVAEITEIGTELGESGSGSGVGYIPHGWKEKFLDPPTRKYVDNPLGRTGTTTVNPAFDINGDVVNPGTLVWMRLRGWNIWHQQYVYDIISRGAGGSDGTGGAGCLQKVLITLCWQGGTLKQIFNIQRGCEVVATSCEDIPTCGSGCDSGTSSNICPCQNTTTPEYWTFSFPTYSTQSGLSSPTEWCMARCLSDSQFTHGCCYVFGNLVCNGSVCAWWQASVHVNSDGSAVVTVSNQVGDLTAFWTAIYYVSSWNCNAANTLDLISHTSYNNALTFPSTLTVSPAADASLCTGSGGGGSAGDCASCGHADSGSFTVAFSGITNGTCTGCTSLSGPIVMNNISTCQYQGSVGSITCGLDLIVVTAVLIDNGSTGWELTFSGIATYFCSYASWNCGGVSTMSLVSSTGQCATWPATVSVTDNG